MYRLQSYVISLLLIFLLSSGQAFAKNTERFGVNNEFSAAEFTFHLTNLLSNLSLPVDVIAVYAPQSQRAKSEFVYKQLTGLGLDVILLDKINQPSIKNLLSNDRVNYFLFAGIQDDVVDRMRLESLGKIFIRRRIVLLTEDPRLTSYGAFSFYRDIETNEIKTSSNQSVSNFINVKLKQ